MALVVVATLFQFSPLSRISEGNVVTVIQEDTPEIRTAYKLDRENCKIDFSKSIDEIYDLIR